MAKKTIAVTGATGHVGKAIVTKLKEAGHEARKVSRTSGVPDDDLVALTNAFTGADAVFLMIPPDFKAPSLRKRSDELGAKLAAAVKAAGVRRVVFLSSLNAHLHAGTGPILGLHDMEERLNALDIPELVHLRPAYFMENLLGGVDYVSRHGRYAAALRPDIAIPMIATPDIGAKAAELLAEEPFLQPRVRELLGPREYTMTEAARILGRAIGKPDLGYAQQSYDEARRSMLDLGLTEGYADAMIELSRHMNEVLIEGTEVRSPLNTTPTTLESFAQEVFRSAYEQAAAVAR
ncbi:MAG: NmrA family NAD(P)-binding protein [Elusimicrobia bacterium]|nr:NmrA family NAD(P)-binding protein [Elusimicrobiota bacterium]